MNKIIEKLKRRLKELKKSLNEEELELLKNDVLLAIDNCSGEKECTKLGEIRNEILQFEEELNGYNEQAIRDLMFPDGEDEY